MEEIVSRGYYEFIPEEYTIFLTAAYFNSANAIVSVHGSGLSNLCFISEKTKVLDMLAPYHQDGYYWMLCNQQNALYTALFAEGDHPPDDLDLVITKNDSDLLIDIKKLRIALDFIERN